MADAPPIPRGVRAKLQWVVDHHPWIWLLIAGEQLAYEHYLGAAAFFAVFLLNLFVWEMWDGISHLITRKRRPLALALIILGGLLLTGGIVLLAVQTAGRDHAATSLQAPPPTVVHDPPSAEDIQKAAGQRIGALEGQITTLQRDVHRLTNERDGALQQMVRNTPLILPAFDPAPILKRRLTRREAADLIDRLNDLSSIVQSAQKIAVPAELLKSPIGPAALPQWPLERVRNGLATEEQALARLSTELERLADLLHAIINGDARYAADLTIIAGRPRLQEIMQAVDAYKSKFGILLAEQPPPSHALIQDAIQEPATRFTNAWNYTTAWAREFNEKRYAAARREIAQELEQ
jgi:hypothetical protein